MSVVESAKISFFQHCGAAGEIVPLATMLDGIKRGAWAGQIKRLRAIERRVPAYAKRKAALPAFMLSGTTNGGHKAADVVEHSGLLQIDVDKVGVDNVASLRDRIGEDRHMLASWVSPSGDGVKGIMLVPADMARHKAAFEAAAEYMRDTYAVEIDKRCCDVGRLCFVSHDPEIVVNCEAVPLVALTGSPPDNSSKSLSSSFYVLGNKAFDDFETLGPLYQRYVARRLGKPQKGERNQALVEIVSFCFHAIAPKFVLVFADEFYHQHHSVFADYPLEQWQREAHNLLDGCARKYPESLSNDERTAYSALADDEARAAFRICKSLSGCESDPSVLPPLFHLSCVELGKRLGVLKMTMWRLLRAFERLGIIKTERVGTQRGKGVQGIATVYRWML